MDLRFREDDKVSVMLTFEQPYFHSFAMPVQADLELA